MTALLSGAETADASMGARRLLDRWPSVPDAIAASFDDLDQVAGHAVATKIRAVRELLLSVTLDAMEDRPLLGTTRELHAYLQVAMAHSPVEELRIVFLNAGNRLLSVELMSRGSADRLCVFPREIVRRALQLRSSALVLAHNHPGGATRPSGADLRVTQQLIALATPFDIAIHDHVLVTRGGCTSLRALGLM